MAVNLQLGALVLESPSHSSPLDINLSPAYGVDVIPDTGALTFVGLAPTVLIAVPAGALNFTGLTPTILTPVVVSVGVGTVVCTGLEPEIITLTGSGAEIPTGTVDATGLAPTVLTPRTVPVPLGAATFTGLAPTFVQGVRTQPGVGSLVLTGLAPKTPIVSKVPAGTVAFTGLAPKAIINNIVQPGVGSLVLTGLAPAYKNAITSRPPAGTVAFTGLAPAALINIMVNVPTGTMTITGLEPALTFSLSFAIQPLDKAAMVGGTVSFYAQALGEAPIAYQWYEETAGLLVGETSQTLTLTNLQASQLGQRYYVNATDAASASLNSRMAFLEVRPLTANNAIAGNVSVYFVMSGGYYNTDPRLSLGGPASLAAGGIPMPQLAELITPGDAIPGVEFIGSAGVALGTATLSWDAGTGVLTWTDSALNTATVYLGGASGLYQTSGVNGRAMFKVETAYLPGVNDTATYHIADWHQNVFDDVSYSERAVQHYNYRAFFLRNNTTSALVNAVVAVTNTPTYGTIALGSEYATATGTAISADYREHNAVYDRNGMMLLAAKSEATVSGYIDYYHWDGVFQAPTYPATVLVQVSDGVHTNLPLVLADEYDSLMQLSNVNFGASVTWANVPAQGYVSFWIRRAIPPGSSGTALTLDDFNLSVTYTGA